MAPRSSCYLVVADQGSPLALDRLEVDMPRSLR
jgi:hypothetical protein